MPSTSRSDVFVVHIITLMRAVEEVAYSSVTSCRIRRGTEQHAHSRSTKIANVHCSRGGGLQRKRNITSRLSNLVQATLRSLDAIELWEWWRHQNGSLRHAGLCHTTGRVSCTCDFQGSTRVSQTMCRRISTCVLLTLRTKKCQEMCVVERCEKGARDTSFLPKAHCTHCR